MISEVSLEKEIQREIGALRRQHGNDFMIGVRHGLMIVRRAMAKLPHYKMPHGEIVRQAIAHRKAS